MADEHESDSEDLWLQELRSALADTSESSTASESIDDPWNRPAEPPATESPAAPPEPPEPVAEAPDHTGLVLDALAQLSGAVASLRERIDALDVAEPAPVRLDQAAIDAAVSAAISESMGRSPATGAGVARLETEVQALGETVATLNLRMGEFALKALSGSRPDKDVDAQRLADTAATVARQVAAAVEARKSFEAGVDKLLRHAREGDSENVAWTDVMLLTHELRSRVDDLDDQQRRALRELSEWQSSIDDRLSALRAELVYEVRQLRDQV